MEELMKVIAFTETAKMILNYFILLHSCMLMIILLNTQMGKFSQFPSSLSIRCMF